jgi:L,D-transpeptidase catalytic domain
VLQITFWHCLRLLPISAIVAANVVSSASAQPAPPTPSPPGAASLLPDEPEWVLNFEEVIERFEPNEDSEPITTLRPWTYLSVRGYRGEWAEVFNPRTRVVGFIPSDVIGPIEAPPTYLSADPPPAIEELNAQGRFIRGGSMFYYPTPDPEVRTDSLPHNAPVAIVDSVEGDDGEIWYRTPEGDYLPGSAVRLARPPARTFAGRWIDVDLREPAMLVAYEGDTPVLTTLAIHGTGRTPTPLGVYRIQRRVADETMDSDTIGIPRFGPGGYYLQHVLFTQYFTGDGASIHYNYWSSNWGYSASHGCLGLTYADSSFLWSWAGVGTPISIHY